MSWWDKFDRWLSKVENKGFKFANKLHVYTINFILFSLAYGTYTLFRDYNEFFKIARVINISKPLVLIDVKQDPNYLNDDDEEGQLEAMEAQRDKSKNKIQRMFMK